MDWMQEIVGVPYREGGAAPEEGFDCLTLVRWVIRRGLGVDLPERPMGWRRHVRVLPFSMNDIQRYDLLFFSAELDGVTTHIGIANSRTDFTHASQHHKAVVCEPVGKYRDVIEAIGRVKSADRD